MTLILTEERIKDRYPSGKATGKEFDEKVVIRRVNGFEMNDCTFTYDDAGGSDVKVLELDNCENIRLINCHFPKKKKHLDVVFLHNECKKITIKDCDFQGKEEKGNFIDVKEGFDITIKHCTFKNHSYNGNNGGEAILIGRGDDRDKSFDTDVIDCTFTNCNGDVELISIKQPGTEIVHNTFEGDRWKRGNVSIRFGKDNIIKDNTFNGKGGGIVVRGSGNEILDNTHKGNKNNNEEFDYRPLTIENGRGNEYARAVNNTIVDNTYENCKGPCIVLGQERSERNQDEFPKDNTFKNNTVIADDENSFFCWSPSIEVMKREGKE